ncbi:MAG: YraN family protein [Roseburia sp.]|nr:YraN family protein [Roseburia sp.]
MNRRTVGGEYEKRAGDYLIQQGYRILEYNFRCRSGEIDIIAEEGNSLVFAEVKYRRTAACGNPLEAVGKRKQQSISRTAAYYCLSHGYGTDTPCRFDVIAVLGDELIHVKHAFEYCG